jgi:hypothetical protein
LDGLSPDEREVVELMLQEISAGDQQPSDDSSLMGVINQVEYKHPLVDMKTFCLDKYYLGNTCDNIYPRLLDDLTELFSGGYNECIFTGSIGYGKTFAASIGICRILYELSCMESPHDSFGLAKDSNISIVNLSVNETLAIKVIFENIATKIRASPYFQENFPFKVTKKELRFPGNVWVAARASTDSSALGLNVVSGAIDETNFMHKSRQSKQLGARKGIYDKAENLYAAIKRRMKSRFERHGSLPGILFLVSSKRTKDDFTARRVLEARDDPEVFVRDYSLWDVKPEEYYSARKFWVLCGNESIPSKIVEDEELDALKKTLPEGCVIIDVPEDFKPDFERDLEGAIRDIAGVATVAVSPFIQRREKIDQAIDDSRLHPFSTHLYDPSRGGKFLWGRMLKQVAEPGLAGAPLKMLRPRLDPHALRHVHIDPSLTSDSTGFCMAHIGGWTAVDRRSEDGVVFQESAPVYVVDVVLQIVPPPGEEIVLGDIRRLVYDLTEHGYSIACVSMDSYQSADSLQQFTARGYNTELVSVDKTIEPYDNLKLALYENRLKVYRYPPLIDELQKLELDREKNKVDHPPHGSKDVSDALAGCLFTLLQHRTAKPLPMLKSRTYAGDAWMEEQKHAVLAGQRLAGESQNLADILPPFLVGYDTAGDEW